MTLRRRRHGRLARGLLLSLQLLLAHRLRTALGVSGLLAGVAAVIVMVAIGQGAERRVLQRVQAMGTNLLVVSAAPAQRVAARPRQVAVHTMLRPGDAEAIERESALAVAAAPAVNGAMVVRWEGVNTTTTVTGTTVEGLRMRNISAVRGRVFEDDDDRQRRRVALVGPTVVRSLFDGADPVGRVVRIGNVPFEVIGMTRARGVDPNGADLDDVVVVPLETAMRRLLNIPYVHALFVQAPSSGDLDGLERDVREILQGRYPGRSGMLDLFVVQSQTTLLRTERGAARAMNQLIVGVSLLSLLAGGVGIVAVMLIAVRERTREIGLRRALGAKRRDIRLQFMLESTMLAAGGGLAGVAVGLAAAAGAAAASPWDLVVSWPVAGLGVVCSTILGLIVGVIPAARAARLEPIAALRAE
ncbi:MAG TPA: ABC transporter permease [Vicinamibacterales bacterium]|nr:ABC transporter permease [Vicinamibacterales bacterium]